MANEILDSANVMRQLFGEREGLAYQTSNALPQGVIEAFDVMGFPRLLRDGFVPLRRHHSGVGVLVIRMEGGLFPVDQRHLRPQRFGTVTTAIPDMKRHDLAGDGVHGDPDSWLVCLFLHKTPHLVGFGFQPAHHHVGWTMGKPHMEVIGTGPKALHHTMEGPGEADAHRTADTTQRDALAQQVFNHGALLVCTTTVFGRGHKLALARLTLMIVFAMAGMAIFLVPVGSTRWARVSDDYSSC